jgi:hypothetical protein
LPLGQAKNKIPLFHGGVIWIRQLDREWITEDRGRFVEVDSVRPQVEPCFPGIPVE